jgi:hypothetical protein
MYYATQDNGEGFIAENAIIKAFETLEEAHEYLVSGMIGFKPETAVFGVGRFSDAWVKSLAEPCSEKDWVYAPFKFENISWAAPGTHPGGNMYWIEPAVDVLVLESIEEEEDE